MSSLCLWHVYLSSSIQLPCTRQVNVLQMARTESIQLSCTSFSFLRCKTRQQDLVFEHVAQGISEIMDRNNQVLAVPAVPCLVRLAICHLADTPCHSHRDGLEYKQVIAAHDLAAVGSMVVIVFETPPSSGNDRSSVDSIGLRKSTSVRSTIAFRNQPFW